VLIDDLFSRSGVGFGPLVLWVEKQALAQASAVEEIKKSLYQNSQSQEREETEGKREMDCQEEKVAIFDFGSIN
jgi:hypothetical protein